MLYTNTFIDHPLNPTCIPNVVEWIIQFVKRFTLKATFPWSVGTSTVRLVLVRVMILSFQFYVVQSVELFSLSLPKT